MYLGVTFSNNVSLTKHKNHPLEQGRKTMFNVLRKTIKLNLPIDMQLQCLIVWLYRYYCMVRKFMVMRNLTLLNLYFYNFIRLL